MRGTTSLVAAISAVSLLSPCALRAEGTTVTAGVAITSNYVSDGHTQSDDNPALQGYVEGEINGFYAGLWMSTVRFYNPDDRVEFDTYFGYRGETTGGLTYDISYYRYLYDDSGDANGEIILTLGAPVTEKLSATSTIKWDPANDNSKGYFGLGYDITDTLSASANVGKFLEHDGETFGDIGLTYKLTDSLSLDGRWYDSSADDGVFVVSFSVDTEIFKR